MKSPRVSQKDLAVWLCLGARRVRELTSRGVLTQAASGYDLKASVAAYLTFLRSHTGSVTDERSRLLKAQADMGELKVRQRTGELVSRTAVATKLFTEHRRIRDQLLNIPSRVSGLLAAESDQQKIHAVLTTEIHNVLKELSNATD